jgi:hypothetical protein
MREARAEARALNPRGGDFKVARCICVLVDEALVSLGMG